MADGKSIKDQIKEKLDKGESIGQADLANFDAAPVETVEEPEEKPEVATDSEDELLEIGSTDQPYEKVSKEQQAAEEFGGYHLGLMEMEPAEVTESDKETFMDCLVDDTRFTRSFSLFNGRITGKFRSRTTEESMAIISEVNRVYSVTKDVVPTAFAATLRHATLAMQIAELKNVEYPLHESPLKAQYSIDEDKVEPPKWWKLVDKYEKMDEGLEQALYTSLLEFERIYWTMVKHAGDQNFWNPEDSSTD